MFQCIGQRRVTNRRNERSQLIRCTKTSELPSNPDKVEWGWLCMECASERPHARKEYEEPSNVGLMQADPAEYKDQIASGFASGARRGYEDMEGEDE